jgi:hypothetical protein
MGRPDRAAIAFATVLGLTFAAPVTAPASAVGAGGGVEQEFTARPAACSIDPNPAKTQIDLQAGDGTVTRRSSDTLGLRNGSALAAVASVATDATVSTKFAGGIPATIAATMSAGVSWGTVSGGATCGAGLWGSGTAENRFLIIQPFARSGWLDLTVTASGVQAANAHIVVNLVQPDGRIVPSPVPTSNLVTASVHAGSVRHAFVVPAGWSILIQGAASANGAIADVDNPTRTSSVGLSIAGTAAPTGGAVTPESGKATARKAVVLPGAVSCAGSARVAVTKYAKKKARSVTFLVNGRTAKKVKRIKKARGYTIRVPQTGGITLTAKVKLKSGKKVSAVRRYAPCG